MPKRLRLSRKKGSKKPEEAVVCSRPSKWGNPWAVAQAREYLGEECDDYALDCVVNYAYWLLGQQPETVGGECFVYGTWKPLHNRRAWIIEHIHELRGKDLMCWCKLDKPCHVEILIWLANSDVDWKEITHESILSVAKFGWKPKIKGLQICDFLRCNACEGSLDCPMIHAYARIYGTEEHPEARQNLDVFFPRTQQGKLDLGKQNAENFSEAVGQAHDTMLENYAQNQKKEEAKKARYSRKPAWLR